MMSGMDLPTALTRLEALGHESVRTRNLKRGLHGVDQFGAKLGDIRKLAKEIGTDHELALALWAARNVDARHLAILLLVPDRLSRNELDAMARDPGFDVVADWLDSYVTRKHPDKESLRVQWMQEADPWAARAGWSLTAERVGKAPDGLDLPGLLDRIEAELRDAPPPAQWTMNNTLAGIGIHFPEHRQRALAIGEALGVYRNYPTPKGCTSPFAPIWITEIVRRQQATPAG